MILSLTDDELINWLKSIFDKMNKEEIGTKCGCAHILVDNYDRKAIEYLIHRMEKFL